MIIDGQVVIGVAGSHEAVDYHWSFLNLFT